MRSAPVLTSSRPLLLLLAAAGAACSSSSRQGPPDGPGPVATVLVTPSPDTVFLSGVVQLGAEARDSAGVLVPGQPFTWQSSNTGIATVSSTGQVFGVAAGQASITASTSGVIGSALVVVEPAPAGSVLVTPGQDSVATGSVLQLLAEVRDAQGTPLPGLTVTWSSTATGIATVTQAGFVTGVSAGDAAIVASYNGITDTAQVRVRGPFTRADSGEVALLDLAGTYQGYTGRLYPGGNSLPASHLAAGLPLANQVVPLDTAGKPSTGGRVVLMSVGMSNATQEWCTKIAGDPCDAWTFTAQAQGVKRANVTILNGAHAGATVDAWVSTSSQAYTRVLDSVLRPAGITEKQVQVIWAKFALPYPTSSLPRADADAFAVLTDAGQVLRALRSRYPNLRMVFLASRTYGGYATVTLNPEPYAFETGLALKWVVEAQIRQMAAGGAIVQPLAGNLNYSTGAAPWVAWGPYLWADGSNARSDGLQWFPGDFESDGTHPSTAGETKVAGLLLDFFTTSPLTRCWFSGTGSCS